MGRVEGEGPEDCRGGAAVRPDGVDWLRAGGGRLTERGHAAASLPDAAFCAVSPPTNELLIVGFDGSLTRLPLPVPSGVDPASQPQPRPTVPAQGRFVSLPAVTPATFTFAAYGEQPAGVVRTVRTMAQPAAPAGNFAFPAYGQEPRSTSFATDRITEQARK